MIDGAIVSWTRLPRPLASRRCFTRISGEREPERTRTNAIAENLDLAKTCAGLAGARFPATVTACLARCTANRRRTGANAILVEHHGPNLDRNDPDFQHAPSGNPISDQAMRTHRVLDLEYRDGDREFYDLLSDPFELYNSVHRLKAAELA